MMCRNLVWVLSLLTALSLAACVGGRSRMYPEAAEEGALVSGRGDGVAAGRDGGPGQGGPGSDAAAKWDASPVSPASDARPVSPDGSGPTSPDAPPPKLDAGPAVRRDARVPPVWPDSGPNPPAPDARLWPPPAVEPPPPAIEPPPPAIEPPPPAIEPPPPAIEPPPPAIEPPPPAIEPPPPAIEPPPPVIPPPPPAPDAGPAVDARVRPDGPPVPALCLHGLPCSQGCTAACGVMGTRNCQCVGGTLDCGPCETPPITITPQPCPDNADGTPCDSPGTICPSYVGGQFGGCLCLGTSRRARWVCM
jgi:hypothetical protein